MHGRQIATEGLDDLMITVHHHVEGEVAAGGGGDRPDVVVHGIALDQAPGGPRIADPCCVVQDQDGLQTSQARSDHLGSAAEAGEEVRLDESGGDLDVGLDPATIEPHRDVGPGPTAIEQLIMITGVVVDHLDGIDHVLTEHLDELGRGVAAVGAGGDQDGHVGQVDQSGEFGQHAPAPSPGGAGRGCRRRPRSPPSSVAPFRQRESVPDPVAQRRTGHRLTERPAHLGTLIGRAGRVGRLDHGRRRSREVDVQSVASVGEADGDLLSLRRFGGAHSIIVADTAKMGT